MAAADSLIGEGLVESPYVEQKRLAELWEKNYYTLLEMYQLKCAEHEKLITKYYDLLGQPQNDRYFGR